MFMPSPISGTCMWASRAITRKSNASAAPLTQKPSMSLIWTGRCALAGKSAATRPEGETSRFRESLGEALASGVAIREGRISPY